MLGTKFKASKAAFVSARVGPLGLTTIFEAHLDNKRQSTLPFWKREIAVASRRTTVVFTISKQDLYVWINFVGSIGFNAGRGIPYLAA